MYWITGIKCISMKFLVLAFVDLSIRCILHHVPASWYFLKG